MSDLDQDTRGNVLSPGIPESGMAMVPEFLVSWSDTASVPRSLVLGSVQESGYPLVDMVWGLQVLVLGSVQESGYSMVDTVCGLQVLEWVLVLVLVSGSGYVGLGMVSVMESPLCWLESAPGYVESDMVSVG